MRHLKIQYLLLMVLFTGCGKTNSYTQKSYIENDFKRISINEIISDPTNYNNKKIELEGYFYFGLEEACISKVKNPELNDRIWIEFNFFKGLQNNGNNERLDGKKLMTFSGKRIKIKGVYTIENKGHLGRYSGAIRDLVYFSEAD